LKETQKEVIMSVCQAVCLSENVFFPEMLDEFRLNLARTSETTINSYICLRFEALRAVTMKNIIFRYVIRIMLSTYTDVSGENIASIFKIEQ
jgi:hypothetical protein